MQLALFLLECTFTDTFRTSTRMRVDFRRIATLTSNGVNAESSLLLVAADGRLIRDRSHLVWVLNNSYVKLEGAVRFGGSINGCFCLVRYLLSYALYVTKTSSSC